MSENRKCELESQPASEKSKSTALKFSEEAFDRGSSGILAETAESSRKNTANLPAFGIENSDRADIIEPKMKGSDNSEENNTRPADACDGPDKAAQEAENIKELRDELSRQAADDKFAGAVLIARDGKEIYAESFGLADREGKLEANIDSKFRFGSMGKMFTAAAVLKLAQEGKLSLDDKLSKFLPDYANAEFASKVSLKELLSHTGGAGDIFGPQYDQQNKELKTIQDYIKLYGNFGEGEDKGKGYIDPASEQGKPEPGKFAYSNYGYMLLGAVISQVTGKSAEDKASGQGYYDYLNESIFKPLGMDSTGLEPEDSGVEGLSKGYMEKDGDKVINADTLPFRGSPAGGGYSTVRDFLKFANALSKNQLLNKEYSELLTSEKVKLSDDAGYAYGFFNIRKDGIAEIGHSGGAPGMNGILSIFPESGYASVVLSNFDPPAANKIGELIREKFPKK